MADGAPGSSALVVVTVNECLFGLLVRAVGEIFRPLPIVPMPDAPEGVLGVSVVRGRATPIVDAGTLLGGPPLSEIGRFVRLDIGGERQVALAVSGVVGVLSLEPSMLQELPPLLEGADAGVVEVVAARDDELLSVLRLGRLIPRATWEALASEVG